MGAVLAGSAATVAVLAIDRLGFSLSDRERFVFWCPAAALALFLFWRLGVRPASTPLARAAGRSGRTVVLLAFVVTSWMVWTARDAGTLYGQLGWIAPAWLVATVLAIVGAVLRSRAAPPVGGPGDQG